MPAVHVVRHSPSDADHSSRIPPTPGADFDPTVTGHYLGAAPERARFQPRRTSALSYQSSGPRDPRDRGYARTPKSLVVVIPPPDFPLDQGQLGNVLSMGPRHRLSQGILMPLFPSMLGQLNAIAREFNFPNIVGICLYLHINENGMTMTPRISDDSWQYLFGHLFENRQPSGGQQLPLGGSIEFDIDLDKARWFDTWVTGTLRDSDPPYPSVVTSQTSFAAHWRGESQTTHADEHLVEDRWDASGSHTLVTNSRPETLRHLPRKLSLVDRLESHGVLVPPKLQNHPDSPPEMYGTQALSPIPQSAIPRAAKSDLDDRVNSWRATTELYPASMTETYQPVPDVGVSIGVTTMDEYAMEHNVRKGVNNDGYLWSATSRNPVMESPIASSRPASTRLDHRANGSVPLTPTAVTSYGPADDKSIISSESQLPTPDMGECVVEDTMAPSLCAVWGNSFGWHSARTWQEVYPYSATQAKPVIRVQLQNSSGPLPQYPSLVIYPSVGYHLDGFEHPKPFPQSVWGSSFGWRMAVTWRMVYPYSTVTKQSVAPIYLRGAGSKYPNLLIYPEIYPYSEVYPPCIVEEDISQPVSVTLSESSNFTTSYPSLVIYPAAYPHLDIYPQVVEGMKTKGSSQVDANIGSLDGTSTLYPHLVIYPVVYPYFDLYPKALQITETLKQQIDAKLVNVNSPTAGYPNMTIYPSAYPHLEIYPTRDTRRRDVDAQSKSISRSRSQDPVAADIVVEKQPVWGSSFGWRIATTWRAVWPTHARIHPNASSISVHLGQQSDSSSNYPHLYIYPAAYPHFDIYLPRTAIVGAEDSQTTKQIQLTVNLIPLYPSLVIYPAVYPHLDIYPAFARDSFAAECGKGQSNLRRRRIEMWRAKTAAHVGLVELLANNHMWEVDEPLQLDLADYTWSQSSAGPPTPPLELPRTPSVPGSVHIDRRIQGSLLPTPSIATTWGPQDDEWYSDILSIERLPSPDLGQRVRDDIESTGFSRESRHMIWPFFGNASQVKQLPSVREKSDFVPEYPHLVIYPPAYPHFELYPTWANVSPSKSQITETLPISNIYPALDIYPAVYPHFNIYPIGLQIEIPCRVVFNACHEPVEVKLPPLYPNFDIYHACYPYDLDCIYPFNAIESTRIPVEACSAYPWLVIYPPVYPFIIPYPGSSAEVGQPIESEQSLSTLPSIEWNSVIVKLPVRYPILRPYSAGYPWSLEFVYPAVSLDDHSEVVKPQYPCIWIYPAVYPLVQPYPGVSDSVHIPGALDECEYESAKAVLALSEPKRVDLEYSVYPYFDLYPAFPMLAPQQEQAVQDAYVGDLATPPSRMQTLTRRNRKTHMELHAAVFRSLEKRPVHNRNSRTHVQLHNEVFQDGVVWTPSGYVQDLSYLTTKIWGDLPVRESQRRPSQDNSIPRPSRSRSGTITAHSTDKVVFPLGQPPALPPLSPLRVRSPGVPSQPSLAVSETPTARVSSPSSAQTHKRTVSSRVSQAVRSMMPGIQRRNSSGTPGSPPEDYKEHAKDHQSPTRFLSLVDRRSTVVPPLPHTKPSEFLTRAPQSSQRKESLVLQRARAYEQSTANQSSVTVGNKVMHSPFTLPPLPSIPPMTDAVTEVIENSKITFT